VIDQQGLDPGRLRNCLVELDISRALIDAATVDDLDRDRCRAF